MNYIQLTKLKLPRPGHAGLAEKFLSDISQQTLSLDESSDLYRSHYQLGEYETPGEYPRYLPTTAR